MSLTEADGKKTGRRWRVRIIAAGESANGIYYPLETLHASRGAFEGARVLSRSDEDHTPPQRGTSVENTVGRLMNVTETGQGLEADMVLLSKGRSGELAAAMAEAWEQGWEDFAGLSINALGVTEMREEAGRTRMVATSIQRVRSVDLVVDPAAGGGLLALTAARTDEDETMDALKKLLALIESHFPAQHKTLEGKGDDVTLPDAITALSEGVKQVQEGKLKLETSVLTEATVALTEATRELAEARGGSRGAEGSGGSPAAQAGPQTPATQPLTEAQIHDILAKRDQRTALVASRTAGMPDALAARVRERASTVTELTEATLTEIVESEVRFAREMGASFEYRVPADAGGEAGARVVGLTEAERLKLALDGLFAEADQEHNGEKVPRATSIRDIYIECTGDEQVRGVMTEAVHRRHTAFMQGLNHGHSSVFTEALSSTSWANVLGDSITRRVQRDFRDNTLMQEWRLFADVVPVRDFRSQERTRWGGYGNLAAVSENAPYLAQSSPTDSKETYSITKRGGLETVSIEAIANDDVGQIRRIPGKMSYASLRTLYEFVFDFFTTNPNMTDGNAWMSGAHANAGVLALTPANLISTYKAMLKQTEPTGSGGGAGTRRMPMIMKYILGPVDLKNTMWELTTPQNAAAMAGADNTELAWTRQQMIRPITVVHWPDASDWYAAVDKAQAPILEIGFLNGREEPEIFLADNPSQGSLFTNDQLQYKIRHIYGGVPLAHQGVYGQIVA